MKKYAYKYLESEEACPLVLLACRGGGGGGTSYVLMTIVVPRIAIFMNQHTNYIFNIQFYSDVVNLQHVW